MLYESLWRCYIDCNLSWKKQGEIVSAKAARGLGVMRRLEKVFPVAVVKLLYSAIVHPYITHGCSVWASNFERNYKRTQIIQNKALRLIAEFQNFQNTAECFRNNDILNISELRDHQLVIIVFQSVNKLSPEHFYDFFLN